MNIDIARCIRKIESESIARYIAGSLPRGVVRCLARGMTSSIARGITIWLAIGVARGIPICSCKLGLTLCSRFHKQATLVTYGSSKIRCTVSCIGEYYLKGNSQYG